jgi:hypothetical protein
MLWIRFKIGMLVHHVTRNASIKGQSLINMLGHAHILPVYHSCTHTNLLQPFHVYCSGACLTAKLPMYMLETHHKPCITRGWCSTCQVTAVWQALQIIFQPYLHVYMQ